MADNRDAIVDAVVARMQGITIANGYLTGAGQRVFLAVIGGGALLLGARLMWRPSP